MRKTGWRGADRRYALVELTPAGQALCHELDDEVTQLKDMLRRLTRNAGEAPRDVAD